MGRNPDGLTNNREGRPYSVSNSDLLLLLLLIPAVDAEIDEL